MIRTHEQFLHFDCWFRIRFSFCVLIIFLTLCDYFILVLFAFVELDLVSSLLR